VVSLNQSGRPLISIYIKTRSAWDFKKFGIFASNSSVSNTGVGYNASCHVQYFCLEDQILKNFYKFFLIDRAILNRTTDIKTSNSPVNNEPRAINVEGIEKYLVSLKIAITITE